MSFALRVNQENIQQVDSVPEDYVGGVPENEAWSKGVLNQIHITSVKISLNQGVNEIELYAMDAGFVLEELFIYRMDIKVPESYLGPCESWHTR